MLLHLFCCRPYSDISIGDENVVTVFIFQVRTISSSKNNVFFAYFIISVLFAVSKCKRADVFLLAKLSCLTALGQVAPSTSGAFGAVIGTETEH